jgi:hypothetical protein
MVFGITNPFVAKSNSVDLYSVDDTPSTDDTSTLRYDVDDYEDNNSVRSILRRRYKGRRGHTAYERNVDRNVSWCSTLDDARTYDTDGASATWSNGQETQDERLHRGERDDDTYETNDDTRDEDDDDTLDTNGDSSRDDDTFVTNDGASSSCDDDGADDDTYATSDNSRGNDTYERDLDVVVDFDSIYPGETRMSCGKTSSTSASASVSEEDDCIEIEHVDAEDHRMIQRGREGAMEARVTSRGEEVRFTATLTKRTPPSPSLSPPPPPSANMMCQPKSIERKQLVMPTPPTPKSMLKRIGIDDITIRPYEKEVVNDIELSRVFVPKLIDLPLDELVIDDVSTIDSSSTLNSSFDEERGVDVIHDDIAATVELAPPVSNEDRKRFSFNTIPSLDESRIRSTGGSDDTSMRSLTKKEHDFGDMFKIQKRADTLAGHIGLILPFWGGRKREDNEPLPNNSTSCEGGTDAIAATRDSMTTKIPSPTPAETLQSNPSTYLSKDSSVKSPYSDNDYYDDVKILPGQSTDKAQSDNGGYTEDPRSMNNDVGVAGNEEGKLSHLPKKKPNDAWDTTSPPHQRIISDREVSAESLKKKKQSINEFDIEKDDKNQGIFDVDYFVPSDSSSGMESNSDESELSTYAVTRTGELISIQDLGASRNSTKMGSIQSQTGEGRIPLYLRDDFMDQITSDILKMSNDHKPLEKRKQWPWAWKRNSKKDDLCSGLNLDARHHPIPLGHRSNRVSDKYDPKELPSGRVHDDDFSCTSCVSADSILTELKVIENTAKLMYQKVILGDSGDMGPSKNYIAALFSPEETELVLKTKGGARGDIKCEQPVHRGATRDDIKSEQPARHREETKKGGVFSKILGRSSSTKTRKFGPVFGVSVSWTPK